MAMWRSTSMAEMIGQIRQMVILRAQASSCSHSTMIQNHTSTRASANAFENRLKNQTMSKHSGKDGHHVIRKNKIGDLIDTLRDLKDSKEAVYGALDAWVAWEQSFPIGRLKMALITLEKEQQWHRAVQVIKWMLSKGQGITMGTYGQLIRALDMDQRPKEADEIWVKKVGRDLHSVPWKVCDIMISVYYRNKMMQNVVKLFKSLEAFDRKPPEEALLLKVADAYQMLGLLEEKERILEKYSSLFKATPHKKREKSAKREYASRSDGFLNDVQVTQQSKDISKAIGVSSALMELET